MLTNLKRVIRAGWQSFFRDGGLVLATIFTMLLTLFLMGSILLMKDVSKSLITSLQSKVDFSVYFKEGTGEGDILAIKDKITQAAKLTEINYVSKEEALAEFTQRHQDNASLMGAVQEVGGNPFLASLNIKALEASQYQAVANFLENSDSKNLIESIDYLQRKPVIEKLFSLTSTANTGGIILSLILTIVAILVTFNTIRLSIYNLREEIKVQRLVGASNWFIRGPFLVQGTIVGIFAALLSFLIFSLTCWLLAPKINVLFSDLNLFQIFLGNLWQILLLQIFAGIGLGVISAILSTRKYLKA